MSLDVWLHDVSIATLHRERGLVRLRWSEAARARWGYNARVLSQSLPITERPARIDSSHAFFTELLPEGTMRARMAATADVAESDTYALLEAYGQDCAGAVVVLPSGSTPPDQHHGTLVAVSNAEIGRRLSRGRLDSLVPAQQHEGSVRTSLAGVQGKVLLRGGRGSWNLPLDGAVSTHIVKPPHAEAEYRDLVRTETLAMNLARRVGVTTVEVWNESFGDVEASVISRYDRHLDPSGELVRTHQEDLCQATSTDGRKKYQRDGGPGLRQISEMLRRSRSDLAPLLRLTTFNVAIGNGDAHAKNLSLLRHGDARVELAPGYDLSPHMHYAAYQRQPHAAMSVGGEYDLRAVSAAHLVEEATRWGMDRELAREEVSAVLARVAEEVSDLSRADLLGVDDVVVEVISERVGELVAGRRAQPATSVAQTSS